MVKFDIGYFLMATEIKKHQQRIEILLHAYLSRIFCVKIIHFVNFENIINQPTQNAQKITTICFDFNAFL